MRHRLPISKANLHWNYKLKKLSLVEDNFSPHNSINILAVEIINGSFSFKDLDSIANLHNNIWGIKEDSIYEFFGVYANLIPSVRIFEKVDI